MSTPQEYQIAQGPITCHSFNADRSRKLVCLPIMQVFIFPAELAVSLNSNEAQVMSRHGSEWKVTETLSEVCKASPYSSSSNKTIATSMIS